MKTRDVRHNVTRMQHHQLRVCARKRKQKKRNSLKLFDDNNQKPRQHTITQTTGIRSRSDHEPISPRTSQTQRSQSSMQFACYWQRCSLALSQNAMIMIEAHSIDSPSDCPDPEPRVVTIGTASVRTNKKQA